LDPSTAHLGVEILNAARRWARARNKCRRLFDSKSASPHEVEAAKNAYNKASDEMELTVMRLERMLRLNGLLVPMNKRPRNPFPWPQFLNAISQGARALEQAVNQPDEPLPVEATVIDVEPEK
jgi:hypothetical protein